jgi:hypothetical protein
VTLRGTAPGPMFATAGTLCLSGLTLTHPQAAVVASIVSGDAAHVVLAGVRVENTPAAFLVRLLRAERSRFVNNGDLAAPASGGHQRRVRGADRLRVHRQR